MNKALLIGVFLLAGCTRGTGKFQGKVIDVSWEGWFFPTCEIDAQYGEQSSKTARFSSEDQQVCLKYEASVGKAIKARYRSTRLECITCGSSDIIE